MDAVAVAHRYVSFDGQHEVQRQDFTYSTTWNGLTWSKKTTAVATTDLVRNTTQANTYLYSGLSIPPGPNVGGFSHAGLEQSITTNDWKGKLLETVTKGWYDQFRIACEVVTLGSAGPSSAVFYSYGSGGQITDKREYNFGAVSAGQCVNRPSLPSATPTRETVTTYQGFSATTLASGQTLLDRPCRTIVYGLGATKESETDVLYDGGSMVCGTAGSTAPANVALPTGTHHTLFNASSSVSRGNPTQITRRCFPLAPSAQSCSDTTTSYSYDIAGQVTSATDGNGHTTSYSHSDPTSGGDPAGNSDAYLTNISYPTVGSFTGSQSFSYNYFSGSVVGAVDENGMPTSYQYGDNFGRLTQTSYPDSGAVTTNYTDPTFTTSTVVSTSPTSPGVTKTVLTSTDGVAHVLSTQLTSDPVSTDSVETQYDGEGLVYTKSNPHRTPADVTSAGVTTFTYDALGRPSSQVDPLGNTSSWTYNGNAVMYQDGNGNEWTRYSDGLGRLITVLEPTAPNTPPTIETDYGYNSADGLTSITQWGGPKSSSGSVVRTFAYNSLDQLTSATNAELGNSSVAGTITYSYDLVGNLTQKTGPAVNATTGSTTLGFCYDARNRLSAKFYGPPSCTNLNTPTLAASFSYDASSVTGSLNTKGRLTSEVSYASGVAFGTRSSYAYDPMGRVTGLGMQGCIPNCVPANFTYTYNQAGDVASSIGVLTNNGIALSFSYDSADHLKMVTATTPWADANHPTTLFSATSTSPSAPAYGPIGLQNASLGVNATTGVPVATIARAYEKLGRLASETDQGTPQKAAPTASTGSISFAGSEQQKTVQGQSATPSTGSVTINGAEQSAYPPGCQSAPSTCPLVYDDGTITIQVSGSSATAYYSQGSTGTTLASALAAGLTSSTLVKASASGNTVYLKSVADGANVNYALLASVALGSNSTLFSSPSFTVAPSGTTMTGGNNAVAGNTLYDAGVVTIVVNGTTASANWGKGSTPATIASNVASALQGAAGSFLHATASGSSVSLSSNSTGSATNWALAASSSYDTADFPSGSFTVAATGMAGGSNETYSAPATYSYQIPASGGYDPAGNVTSFSDSVVGAWTFSPDSLNRVSSGSASTGSYAGMNSCWSYDPFGNRKSESVSTVACQNNPPLISWAHFNSKNQVIAASTAVAGFYYDAAGNVINDGNNAYLYDPESRLCAVQNLVTKNMVQYLYDADGRRVGKGAISSFSCNVATNGFILQSAYLVDAQEQVTTELGPNGNWVHTNVFAAGQLLATYEGSDTYFAFHDWLGTKRAEAGAGGCLSTFSSLPYGDMLTSSGNCPDATEQHYTGKERDAESGLDDFGPRYYGSNMGRFMSPDEFGGHLEDPQTLNKYSYVGNNPLSRTDPSGHDFWQSCDKASASCGNQQIGTNKDGSAINHLVQGTTDSNGKFSSTVITSASLGQAGSGNSATVNGNGVMVTSSTGTAQGIFINGTPSATIQGDANSAGWSQFSFHIDSNDAFHGVLNAGEATYTGSGGHDGMVSAIEALKVNGKGPFSYTEEMFGNPFHPGASNFRFSSGDHPEMFNYGPSPHFAVPKAGTSSDFHTDSKTGPAHLSCALGGVGCY